MLVIYKDVAYSSGDLTLHIPTAQHTDEVCFEDSCENKEINHKQPWWGATRPGELRRHRKTYWAWGILKCLPRIMLSREPPVDQYNLSRAHASCQGFMSVITSLIIRLGWRNPWRRRKRYKICKIIFTPKKLRPQSCDGVWHWDICSVV